MADATALVHTLDRLARLPQPPWLHGEIARRMAQRLPVVKRTPTAVIDWWGWLGGSASELARTYPKAKRVVVEPTAALQARSASDVQRPWWSFKSAPQVVRDSEAAAASGQLLWANMMLHAVPDVPALLAQWRRVLEVDGFLMFSTFGPDTVAELHALYRSLGWQAPGPLFADMHDIGDQLVHAGFADPVMDQEHITLTWSTPQALLAELRTLGSNTEVLRAQGLFTPRWRSRLLDALRAMASADGRLQLTFEIIYGHAFNPPPRAKAGPQTAVSLDDMRAMVKAPRTLRG